jgi:hypothetical protein
LGSSGAASFWRAASISRAPTWMPVKPRASSTCGGERIFTSSPYALCHQLSNGAEVIIAIAPQIDTQAPKGPENPQKRTLARRAASVPANVVRSTSHPHATPATMPPR